MESRAGATGFFRLLRQQPYKGGYFGQVTVRLAERPIHGSSVEWRIDMHDRHSVRPDSDLQVFVDAALKGTGDGVEMVSRCGVDTIPYTVDVINVPYRAVDIEVTSVRAAAALAVADAFGVIDRMGLSFDERGGGSFGPGPEPRYAVGRWTAHLVEGLESLGPLATKVLRSRHVVQLSSAVQKAHENMRWVLDGVVVISDRKADTLSFTSVSNRSTTELVSLASLREIMVARSNVEQGRPPTGGRPALRGDERTCGA